MKIPLSLIVMGVIAALIIGGAYAVTLALARPAGVGAAQQATTGTPGTATTAAQASPTQPGTPVPVSLVRVWSQMCVDGVPYTLMAVPTDAKFALVLPEPSPSLTTTPGAATGAATSAPGAASGTATSAPGGAPVTATPQASIGPASPSTVGGASTMPGEPACTGLGTINGNQLVMCTGTQGTTFTLYVHNSKGTEQYHGDFWTCTSKKAAAAAPGLVPATSMPGTPPASTQPAPTQPAATNPAPTSTP